MTQGDVIAIGLGIAAIAWINWYFFFAGNRRAVAALQTAGGADEVIVVVQGGYEPSLLRAKTGRPLRIVFDRRDTSGCSEEVVFPDFGIRKFLPTGQRTTIEVTPPKAGRYEFMCGMSMLRGALVAED